ncbi:sensor histidine kinase [Desulfosarcina ovata]|uniref:histidine kinase n=1 Tax=Desulfosarcina ovata subsp. ovata TaxID=2752305 RepID=A0A5K8A454_9BACT|nr:sensor histidine kinase [Desulfosarcina ovata]BBO87070.1 two-component sensor histidine kinase [Desulfosarcina ovata subsp. ovata]
MPQKSTKNSAPAYAGVKRFVLINMIVVPFIPFLLALIIGNHSFSKSLQENTISAMERIAADHRQMIESFLLERKNDLELIVNTTRFDEIVQPGRLDAVFDELQQTSSAFVDLGIFDATGMHVAYHGPFDLTGKNYRQTDWFQQTLENSIYISDVFLGFRNVPHFIIAVAQKEAGRNWVIRATVDSQRFNNLVRKIRIGKTGEAYLLNRQGVLQTDRRSGGNLMETPAEKIPLPANGRTINSFIHRQGTEEPFLYATCWLKDNNWILVIRQEKADAFMALQNARLPILFICLVGGGCIVAAAFTLTGVIVRKMEQTDAEKALLNQQLIGASRLAELGEMAAGFAHEINNPLQIISSELSMIRVLHEEMVESAELTPGESFDQVNDSVAQIKMQLERCARITAAILKFGRQGESSAEELDLTVVIPEITHMAQKKAEVNGILLQKELPSLPIRVYADASRLQQVVLNLLNNAMDAIMDHHGTAGGSVIVSISQGDNESATISVKDNGSGITQENMEKIFSPFFTTKPVGKGTGLGLSVCYGIVQQMGGKMEVASSVGQGTTFSIVLPALPSAA